MKTIRTKFIKNINQQKNIKLAAFDRENSKLKKGEKNPIKFMTKKEYNKNIKEKRDIIVEYYDSKINEINLMKISDFILKFLSKEKTENIKSLMNTNLNSKFSLDRASTDISNKVDVFIEEENKEDEKSKDDIDAEVKSQIDRIFNKARQNRVKDYIDKKIEITNFLPRNLKN